MEQHGWMARLRRAVQPTGRASAPSGGALVVSDVAAATRQQQERVWSLVRRGKRALLIAAALMLGALVIATARGYASWSSAALVVVALLIAGLFALIDRRLANHPPGSVEVPTDLADLIVEITQIRDEIRIFGPDQLAPDLYERVVDVVGGHVSEIVAAAAHVLTAERAGERDVVVSLRADIGRRFEAVMDIYEDLDIGAGETDLADEAERLDGQGRGNR